MIGLYLLNLHSFQSEHLLRFFAEEHCTLYHIPVHARSLRLSVLHLEIHFCELKHSHFHAFGTWGHYH